MKTQTRGPARLTDREYLMLPCYLGNEVPASLIDRVFKEVQV